MIKKEQKVKINHSRRKRCFDLTIATLALAVLLPFLLVIALIIKCTYPRGKAFFRHARLGQNGEVFKVYKFSTMIPDAEEVLEKLLKANPSLRLEWEREFKLRHDPRIIPGIGNILRKSSLDELPQLINIIKGEMSFVGPRPITVEEIPKYGEHYATLVAVKPGLTGAWQVSGRNDLSYEQRVDLDMAYIKEISMGHDFRIILKTVKAVLDHSGAY